MKADSEAIATFRFNESRQRDFARLSGDFNPLHVDPVFSRRTLFGEPVVHGVHLALWALEVWLADRPRPVALREFRARFQKPVSLNVPLVLEQAEAAECCFRLLARESLFEISGCIDPEPNDCRCVELPSSGEVLSCRETTFSQASECEGEIPLYLDRGLLGQLFPQAAAKLPSVQIAHLLASTRLTGMICPGLRSIFHDIAMRFESNAEPLAMKYRCRQCDPRFSIVQLAVSGCGMRGILSTFYNPAPNHQPPAVEVAKAVRPDEFRGQNALVIGGSRGLGELTAKIIAVGRGSVRLTYHRGRDDGDRVVAELRSLGADARSFPLNVLKLDRPGILEALRGWSPTHLYYFASPILEPSPRGEPFSSKLHDQYRLFYERGLQDILAILSSSGASGICVFYPSTFLLNDGEPRWREFAAAKAEGEETIRRFLDDSGCGSFYAPRLPWLPTDQTINRRLKVASNPVEVLLSEIRRGIASLE
jgi:hypothetical protein